ncbi:6,7-dimethyl-8-ribityllumazine synthase [Rhodovibrionaceae bacterium A322]
MAEENSGQTGQVRAPSAQEAKALLSGARIGFVQTEWHGDVVIHCRDAFINTAVDLGLPLDNLTFHEVPGAFELPLEVQRLAKLGNHDILIACGMITNGSVYRFDFVAQTVFDALMSIQLAEQLPVLSAVLTPIQFHGDPGHLKEFQSDFAVWGEDLARACVKLLHNQHS